MKTSNVNQPGERAHGITRGHTGLRAGSSGIKVTDDHGNKVRGATEIRLPDATVVAGGSGVAVVNLDAPGGDFTQDDADALYLTRATGERHVFDTPTAAATQDFDLSTANTFIVTLTEDCEITLSNPPDSGIEGRWTIFLRQDAAGGWTVAWPASVVWRDTDGTQTATAPDLATAADAGDTIDLRTLDGGATYGASLENGSAGLVTEASLETAGHYEVFMTGATPAEPLEDGSGTDWLYVWVP